MRSQPGTLAASILVGQTLATFIPSAAAIATLPLHHIKTNRRLTRTKFITAKRQDPTMESPADFNASDYAHVLPNKVKMGDSPPYHSVENLGSADTVVTLHNREPTTIGVRLERDHFKMLMPGQTRRQNYIMIPLDHWVLLRMPKRGKYLGTMRAFPGCDKEGWNCFGPPMLQP